ncbi:MAG: FtsX-like permease family protein [Bacteroidales bacterium]|nr:FtsX-like permease family protein [Bacteroidales bacterium]
MKLAFFIAWRYLLAKKSRQVINVISGISAVGIALGTMALVVVMSVYNGFDNLAKSMYHAFDPDLMVKSAEGKTLPYGQLFEGLKQDKRVTAVCPVIEETVFLQYRDNQAVATLKGVDTTFIKTSPLQQHITSGTFQVYFGEVEEAVLGRALALELGVNVAFIDPLWIYYPKKNVAFSPLNPMGSLHREKLFPGGIFAVEQHYDAQHLLVPLETAERLLGYSQEITHVEIRTKGEKALKALAKELTAALGPEYRVLTRYQQNETLYRMMKTEKIIIFFLLGFILVIISGNVLGSLSMLILEKKEDVAILTGMGARPGLIKRIFILEGWLISILGWVMGMVVGLSLCFLQIRFGIISLPGSFVVTNYPVVVQWTDMLMVTVMVLGIGFLAAYVPVRSVFNNSISLAYPGSSLGVSK